MTFTLQDVKEKAHKLSVKDRAELAYDMIISLESNNLKAGQEHQDEWDEEIRCRVNEIHLGKVVGKPAFQMLEDIRKRTS